MSKKKNKKSEAFKNTSKKADTSPKSNSVKATKASSKVYKDEFLGKDIDLPQTPFEVYQDVKESNLPVLRDSAELKKDSQIEEIISQDLDESKLEEFLNSVKKEKADFEQVVNKKIVDEKLKHPIYNHSKPKRQGFLGGVADIFESDILWYSVTFSLVLGLVFFFFNGLQPLILANYLTQSKIQAQSLRSDYFTKFGSYFTTQNNLLQRFDTYNPTLLCSQQQLYTNLEEDINESERTVSAYFPTKDLVSNPSYNNFYLDEVDTEYLRLTDTYKSNLEKYQEESQNLAYTASYLGFRNSILNICQALAAQPRNNQEVAAKCSEFQLALTELKSVGTPSFYPDVQESIETINTSCLNPNELDASLFYLTVDAVMFYRPSFDAVNADLVNLNNDFETKYNVFRLSMDKIYEDKTSLVGMWFILKYDLS
jgi:hypothetical protein